MNILLNKSRVLAFLLAVAAGLVGSNRLAEAQVLNKQASQSDPTPITANTPLW